MKTIFLRISIIASISLLVLTSITSTSCKKPKDCHGDVTVYDTNGKFLQGAIVHVFHKGDTSLVYLSKPGPNDYTQSTDANGKASFVFKTPAVWDVRVDHPKIKGKYKTGVLILNEPGSKDSQTIHF